MIIRPAAAKDWPRIGELSELLVRTHYAFDPSRFIPPDALPGHVYTSRVRIEMEGGHVTVRVAETDGRIVGYVFAGIEPGSWKELRPDAGYVHDLVVDEAHRRSGIGRALVASAIEWFDARDVARIILWTARQNVDAQRLFNRLGFRQTMIEMTLDRRQPAASLSTSR
jgi:ribosomal protein S18 acetylase RimI-like enzyme